MSKKHVSKSAAEWLANALSNEQLFHLLRLIPPLAEEILRGHKMTAGSVEKKLVRKRVVSEIMRNEEVLDLFLEARESPWSSWQEALDTLDLNWIQLYWRNIARAAGPDFIVALAGFPDPELEKRGRRALRTTSPWRAPNTSRAEQKSMPLPAPLKALQTVLCHAVPSPSKPQTTDLQKLEKAEKRTAAAEKEIEKLTAALAKQRARVKDAESTITALENELKASRNSLQQQLRSAEAKYDELATEFDTKLSDSIRRFRREQLGISPRIEKLQAEIESGETAELLDRANAVLQEQAKLNERFGTISQIKTEIADLQAARDELTGCLAQSVRIQPSLHQVQDAVDRRIAELQDALPDYQRPRLSKPARRLLHKIAGTKSLQDGTASLDAICQQVDSGILTQLLSDHELDAVRHAMEQKRRHLHAMQLEDQLGEPCQTAEPAHGKPTEPDMVWDVNRKLESAEKPVILFVDGYNALLRTEPYHDLKKQYDMESARQLFCEHCRRKASAFDRMEVVFDGRGALSQRETASGMTVVFTANLAESQNADNYIVNRMRQEHTPDCDLWLVTDDGGLRHRVRDIAGAVVSSADFVAFLTS